RSADAGAVAAGTGKTSTHPTQRHNTGPGHPRTGHAIRINDPRSPGLDPYKARHLLTVLLRSGAHRDTILATFAPAGTTAEGRG
ncbi:hypothetical protein, partial [Streptomyces sp. NPDC088246]|uniref:hypothetical protein n=1 Tax=Streptomyces sp. NPDC088246 TaxID=3365842 RepID=UPI003805A303